MKINKTSMAIMAAAAILAICPAVHAQDTDTNKPAATRPRGGMTVEAEMDRIDKAVTLTDNQKPKVKTALEDMAKARKEARDADQDERRTKMAAARKDFTAKMKDILTPDQYTKFQAMPRPGRRGAGGGGNAGGAGQ